MCEVRDMVFSQAMKTLEGVPYTEKLHYSIVQYVCIHCFLWKTCDGLIGHCVGLHTNHKSQNQ